MILQNLPRHIDISCVQAYHDRHDVEELAAAARRGGFGSAHVLPNWVPVLRGLLEGSDTLAGGPAGFPSGGSATRIKLAEVGGLLADGAQEVDVVMNVGRLRSMDLSYVTAELTEVVALVDAAVPLRAILEVGHLTDEQILAACDCALEAGVPWIKTGTGWSGRPTTVHHIQLIAERVAGRAQIKASGGIRDLDTVQTMIALGVTRFGLNSQVAVELAEQAGREREASGR